VSPQGSVICYSPHRGMSTATQRCHILNHMAEDLWGPVSVARRSRSPLSWLHDQLQQSWHHNRAKEVPWFFNSGLPHSVAATMAIDVLRAEATSISFLYSTSSLADLEREGWSASE
jgi:hypothetical protein